MAPTDPVLDLTTEHERLTVRVDDVAYPLRTSNDLTLDAYKTLERIGPRIGALLLRDTLTSARAHELSQLLDSACRLALVAPAAVHAKLGDVNRIAVFRVFTERLTPTLRRATSAIAAGRRSPGTTRSRASNGSTAAPPRAGAPTSPSARSART